MKVVGDPKAAEEALGGGKALDLFEDAYRELVDLPSANAGYRHFFTDLADGRHTPALFHCTTGKDRTGWAATAMAGAGGLRNGEACVLDWPDVRLGAGSLVVREAKTAAGEGRECDLPLGVREELTTLKARGRRASGPVFVNRNGRRQTVSNVERRLKTVIRRANERLAELGIEPISERVTPHSLRRTYASLRFALGDDPVYVARQIGHRESAFSMEVYAKAVKRRERLSGAHLREFDRALDWAALGSSGPDAGCAGRGRATAGDQETAWPSHKATSAPIAQLDRATPS